MMSIGFTKDSLMLENVLSGWLSCIERKAKLSTPWGIYEKVLLLCRTAIRIMGLWDWSWLRSVLRTGYPQRRIEVQLLRLAFPNVQSVPLFESQGVIRNPKLFALLAIQFFLSLLVNELVSRRPSMTNCLKSIRKKSNPTFVFHLEVRRYW